MNKHDDAAMPTRARAGKNAAVGFKALNIPDERARHPEPMRTVTFTLPVRLHNEMKKAAVDHETTLKALFQEALEAHLEHLGQSAPQGAGGGARFQEIPLLP